METNYSLAWKKFQQSENYTHSHHALVEKGLKEPYIGNILHGAFEAGWNATGKEIVEIMGEYHFDLENEKVSCVSYLDKDSLPSTVGDSES